MPTESVPKKVSTAKITEVKNLTSDIREISLKLNEPFNFIPGQYVWLELPYLVSPDPRGTRRAFSLTSKPGSDIIQTVFKISESSYKKTLLGLRPTDTIRVHGPFGSFLKDGVEGNTDLIFVAGGLAIAPYLSVIRSLGASRNIYLIHVNKDSGEQIYGDELKSYSDKNITYVPVFGKINQDYLASANTKHPNANWYITGPQSFVDYVWSSLKILNINPEKLNFEEHYPTTDEFSSLDPKDFEPGSSTFFKLATDKAFLHIVITDINGVVVYANEVAQKLTGYTFSEMQGNTPRLWGGMMSPDFYKKLWISKKINKQPFSGRITNRRKNGEIYIAQATISPIVTADGKIAGFIGTEEDITKAEETRSELRRLASIVESSQNAIFSKDLTGMILTWNKGARDLYGYLPEEIIGENIQIIIPENLRSEERTIIDRVKKGEVVKQYDTKRVTKNGNILDVELSIAPIRDENGQVMSVSVVARDITEQKREREQTERLNKLMVGRELRMIELKKQIDKLTGENPK